MKIKIVIKFSSLMMKKEIYAKFMIIYCYKHHQDPSIIVMISYFTINITKI